VNEKKLRPGITNKICKRLWELAQIEPEQTRGSLKGQVDCCEQMYRRILSNSAVAIINPWEAL
jgi:hypothetical protein